MSPGTASPTLRSHAWLTQPDYSAIACWYRLAKLNTTKPVAVHTIGLIGAT